MTATGIEGYTTDGLPLLGTLPAAPQVIMACGFSGSGFKFASISDRSPTWRSTAPPTGSLPVPQPISGGLARRPAHAGVIGLAGLIGSTGPRAQA